MVNRTVRAGFTITESIVALAVMAGVGALVAEHAVWALSERNRGEARLEAIEVAANVLEQGRDIPWKDLHAEWANSRKLPEPISKRWPNCRLRVRVEPEPRMPNVKRVTAEVMWENAEGAGWQPVALTSLLAARSTEVNP